MKGIALSKGVEGMLMPHPSGSGEWGIVYNETIRSPGRRNFTLAHELGHYLGLHHPEEADGTQDDLASTNTDNLMHREPLLRDAEGLTSEQHARLLAHPFVMSSEGLAR